MNNTNNSPSIPVNTTATKLGLSVPEMQQASGIGTTNIYNAMNNGDLVAHKFGKKTIILIDDAMDFLRKLPLYSEETKSNNNQGQR